MRLLLVHPGPDFSVHDVLAGWSEAFRELGVTTEVYKTLSTGGAAGTEIATQTSGYTAGTGWVMANASAVSSAGSAVGVPAVTQSFVSGGSPTNVVSFDLTGSAAQRGFWGPFNGQPVAVASGNTFQVVGGSGAAAGIQVSLT